MAMPGFIKRCFVTEEVNSDEVKEEKQAADANDDSIMYPESRWR